MSPLARVLAAVGAAALFGACLVGLAWLQLWLLYRRDRQQRARKRRVLRRIP